MTRFSIAILAQLRPQALLLRARASGARPPPPFAMAPQRVGLNAAGRLDAAQTRPAALCEAVGAATPMPETCRHGGGLVWGGAAVVAAGRRCLCAGGVE